MQDATQANLQAQRHDGRWPKGVSGNPKGSLSKAEIARRAAETAESLASEFGGLGALSPNERLLIEGAAKLAHLPIRRRQEETVVRIHNSIARTLSIVRKARGGKRGRLLRLSARIMANAR